MSFFRRAPLALLALAACFCLPRPCCCADEAEAAAREPPPLRFRRVFAPEDRLEKWPRDAVRYIPMEPGEFETLVERARLADSAPEAAATVSSASYEGDLADDGLTLRGTATLKVVLASEHPVFMTLSPHNLAITDPVWGGSPPEPARLGLADGKTPGLRVSQSGQLEFDWSIRGRSGDDGAVHFDLNLPPSPGSDLRLVLPESVELAVDEAVVLPPTSAEDGKRAWRILAAGERPLKLRLRRGGDEAPRVPAALIRQSSVYDCSLRGVDVATRLHLVAGEHPIDQLEVRLDRPLKLVTARVGDQPVPWTAKDAEGARSVRAVLQLPALEPGGIHVVRLGALAPITTGRPWSLPRIQPVGEFWQQGETTLLVPRPLVLQHLQPVGCRQLKAGPLAAPLAGESFVFQAFEPEATVRVVLAQAAGSVRLTEGLSVRLGASEVFATLNARLAVEEGERFLLTAQVGRHWVVDSVASTPANVIDDWSIESVEGNRRLLQVRLAKGLVESRSVKLRVAARRLFSPLGRPLSVREMVPLAFDDVSDHRRVVAVSAVEPYRLEISERRRLETLVFDRLASDVAELIEAESPDLLFTYQPATAGAELTLRPQRPKYSAETEVRVEVRADSIRESYRIRCVPLAGRVQRVQVHFSQRRRSPPQWRFQGKRLSEPAPQRMGPPTDAALAMLVHGETWEVELPSPQAGPFELHIERSTPRGDTVPVSLAGLPDSQSETATVHVQASGEVPFRIENLHLDPIPAEVAKATAPRRVRASFRYDPLREALPGAGAGMVIHSAGVASSAAWIWSSRLESCYEANGAGRHRLVCRVENNGRSGFRLDLPEAVPDDGVRGVRGGAEQVPWQLVADGATRAIEVELPRDERFPVVTVDYTTRGEPLRLIGRLSPPTLRPTIPVINEQWIVWVPPDWQFARSENGQPERPGRAMTLSQRLFGPLGRAAHQSPMDPFSVEQWAALADPWAGRRKAASEIERFLRLVGEAAGEEAEGAGPATWGRVLAGPAVRDSGIDVLIDRRALESAGLNPTKALPDISAAGAARRAEQLFWKSGLAVLADGDSLVLTTALKAALLGARVAPLEDRVAWRLLPDNSADLPSIGARLVSPQAWIATPAAPGVVWKPADDGACKSRDMAGWNACRLGSLDSTRAGIVVARTSALRALRWAALILFLTAGWWMLRTRPLAIVLAAGIAAGLCLWLPPLWVPLPSGALLGLLGCLGFWLIRAGQPADEPAEQTAWPQTGSSALLATSSGAALVGLIALAAWAAVARGDEASAEVPGEPPPTYRVFVPIDQERQPTGGKYYVPEPLHNALHQRAGRAQQKLGGWLLRKARYRASISALSGTRPSSDVVLVGTFDLEVFSRATQIALPIDSSDANLVPEGARLDGKPIEAEWDELGRTLRFTIAEPGQYRLELELRPTLKRETATVGFDLAVPPVANAQLEIDFPAQGAVPEVPSALGRVFVQSDPSQLVAELGPAERLHVRWAVDDAAATDGGEVEVEQLLWLKVRPGSVILDTRLICKATRRPVDGITLDVDSQWRLLPLPSDEQGIEAKPTAAGEPGTVELALSEAIDERRVIPASFLFQEASGVGNIRLPRVDVVDARVTRRWLAVGVAPELSFEPLGDQGFSPVAIPDFAAAWEADENVPVAAFDLGSADGPWAMSARPKPPQTQVDQSLAVSFGLHEARVELRADLETTDGYAFLHRLAAPADLKVDEISLIHDDAERVARVAASGDGLTVFLTGPVAGAQRLRLSGRVPLDGPGRRKLPWVGFANAGADSPLELEIYRRPEVLLDVSALEADGAEFSAEPGPEKRELGRRVASLHVPPSELQAAGPMQLRPNGGRITSGLQVTRLIAEQSGWTAEVAFELRCDEGVLDALQLEVPRKWPGPYELVSSEPAELIEPKEPGDELIIRPREPVAGRWELRLSGRLALSPNETIRPPRVALAGGNVSSHLVVLPTTMQSKPIGWKTRNLLSTSLPERNPLGLSEAGEALVFQVTRPDFDAILTADKSRPGGPEVYLAEIGLDRSAGGACRGTAVFTLNPAGLPACVLSAPSGCRLIHVRVAGLVVQPKPLGEGRYRVRLGPPHLPQRVEVVFALEKPVAGGQPATLQVPRPLDMPLRKVIWSVAHPSEDDMAEPAQAHRQTAIEQELARLAAAEAMLRAAADAAFEEPADARRWCRPVAGFYARARSRARRELAMAPASPTTRPAAERLAALDAEIEQLAEAIDVAAIFRAALRSEEVAARPGDPWQQSVESAGAVLRFETPASVEALVLRPRAESHRSPLMRLAGSALLAALVAVLWMLSRREKLADGVNRWPALAGVTLGILWWLFLWPSVLGLALIVVCLIASVRSGWKGRQPGGSTIVPLG